ncbi:hypothetical protein VTP01DRAFT_6844 [Rhizomucor pusillus]|uniref:uncharacterized protein n=1 Tax=Rhizomucor pusillus TaxID=4840 RepID=UPI003742F0B4
MVLFGYYGNKLKEERYKSSSVEYLSSSWIETNSKYFARSHSIISTYLLIHLCPENNEGASKNSHTASEESESTEGNLNYTQNIPSFLHSAFADVEAPSLQQANFQILGTRNRVHLDDEKRILLTRTNHHINDSLKWRTYMTTILVPLRNICSKGWKRMIDVDTHMSLEYLSDLYLMTPITNAAPSPKELQLILRKDS